MKIKFPKSILIGDINFRILTDKSRNSAEFYYWNRDENNNLLPPTIIIGTKTMEVMPIRVLSSILHEIKEIIHVEQNTRFLNDADNSYEFHYSHKEHTDLCCRLAGLLSLFLE